MTTPIDVATGLIDFYLHPPIGRMEPRLDYLGPYEGNVTLLTWSSTPGPIYTTMPVSATYGVQLQLAGVMPIAWGYDLGWVSDDGQYDEATYDPPLGQLVVQHQFPSGSWLTTQREVVASYPTVVLWQESLPGRLGLRTAPGISFDLFYLVREGS